MIYTVIDSTGEILSTVSAPDDEHAAANTPPGATCLEGESPGFNCYYRDSSWVMKPEKPGDAFVWDSSEKAWVDPRSLDDLKAAKWEEIKAGRAGDVYSTFTWDGSTFDCDLNSQGLIQGAVLDAMVATQQGQPFSIAWTLADNTVRVLSAADMTRVGLAMSASIQANFNRGQALRASINAATSLAQLESITWD